jgi:hypothetical protein
LRKRSKTLTHLGVATVLAGSGGVVGSSAPASALTPGWALPLDLAVINNNGNMVPGYCHDNAPAPCTPGSDTANYWSIDLFDSNNPDPPIFATKAGVVQQTGGCGTSLRHGYATSGAGSGWLYCHGKNLQLTTGPITLGQLIMKMSNTGGAPTMAKHLHFEARWMANVGTWSNNFIGYCARYQIEKTIANQTVVIKNAWREPENTMYDDDCV